MGDTDKKPEKDPENEAPKYPYPKSVFFIISTEFCERFSFYGMKTVLALFFNQILGFDQNLSSVLYHAFTAICYFTPMFGAIIADSFVGKFRTIFYISIVYAIGQVVLTIGSIGDTSNGNEGIEGLPAQAFAYIGLLLIALGTGGIKPCVASFGGEQFKLPEQSDSMKSFFSMFYASINAGSLISTLLTPILRQNTKCFGQDTCYPLAFGVPAALMIVAILFFLTGRIFNMYVLIRPTENIIVKTSKCIWDSFKESRRSKEKKPSFLDHGEKLYGKSFIADVKALGNVVYMFLPFPLFWALFDQQGSKWTFQATRMNGNTFGLVILPDMMQVSNPLLILAFIPLFDYGIYPMLTKFNLVKTPLQRIVTGGMLTMLSFVVSGVLELYLEQSYPVLPEAGKMHFTMYNGLENCTLGPVNLFQTNANGDHINQITFDFLNATDKYKELNNVPQGQWTVGTFHALCANDEVVDFPEYKFAEASPPPKDPDSNSPGDLGQHILVTRNGIIKESMYRERIDKSSTGLPIVKFLWNLQGFNDKTLSVSLKPSQWIGESITLMETNKTYIGDAQFKTIGYPGLYKLILSSNGTVIWQGDLDQELLLGANYQILLQYAYNTDPLKDGLANVLVHKITSENEIHIFWLLPQFVIMTAGEIMFSITSLQFSFTQAPETMKAVMMAIRMMTNAIGNIIDLVVMAALADVFSSNAQFFFLFAGLMFLDMVLLGWMATKYTYVDYTTKAKVEENKGFDNKE